MGASYSAPAPSPSGSIQPGRHRRQLNSELFVRFRNAYDFTVSEKCRYLPTRPYAEPNTIRQPVRAKVAIPKERPPWFFQASRDRDAQLNLQIDIAA